VLGVPAEGGTRAPSGRAIVPALLAGVAIGAFYVCIHQASAAAGLWPLVAARTVSLSVLVATTRVRRLPLRVPAAVAVTAGAAGALDIVANACYVMAVHQGLLSVVATLASLYPAVTVLLARVVLKERLRGVQVVGIAIAVGGVALIAAG